MTIDDMIRAAIAEAIAPVAARVAALERAAASVPVPTPAPPAPTPPAPVPATAPAPSGGVVSFVDLSWPTAGRRAFSVGVPLRQGDIPGEASSDTPGCQVRVKGRWPDGSARFAVMSGEVEYKGAPLRVGVRPGVPATATVGRPSIAAGQVVVNLAPFGSVDLATLEPRAQYTAGPAMSEWHYRAPVGADPHLTVAFHVQSFASGKVRITTVIENGWLMVPNPGMRTYACEVKIGGRVVYSAPSIEHRHHTRWSRVDWLDGQDEVTPRHDLAYVRATGLLPNWAFGQPSDKAIGPAMPINPEPFVRGGFRTWIAGGGWDRAIGWCNEWDATYWASGDSRAYSQVVGNARAHGMYPIHYRDEGDGFPVRVSRYPDLALQNTNSGLYQEGNGLKFVPKASESGAGPTYQRWELAHSPSGGYAAYLATGDFVFAEECQFAASISVLACNSLWRKGSDCNVILGSNEVRGAAWAIRSISQAIVATTDPTLLVEYEGILARNIEHVAATAADPARASPLGTLRVTNIYSGASPAHLCDAPWQQNWLAYSIMMAVRMGVTAGMPTAKASVDYVARHPVGMFGDGVSGWSYRVAGSYVVPYGNLGPPVRMHQSWSEAYAAAQSFQTDPVSVPGNTLLGEDYTRGWAATPDDDISMSHQWGAAIPALALAVDLGIPGAAEGWGRLTSASNWPTLSRGFHDHPTFGVVPLGATVVPARAPAPAPAPSPAPAPAPAPVPAPVPAPAPAPAGASWRDAGPLTWARVPDSDIGPAIEAGGYPSPGGTNKRTGILAYSGGCIDQSTGRMWHMGGGHGDYWGNELVQLDLSEPAPAWRVVGPIIDGKPQPSKTTITDKSWSISDGRMPTRHTYNSAHYMPSIGRIVWLGSYGDGAVWSYDVQANDYDPADRWKAATDWNNIGVGDGSPALCARDGDTETVWQWAQRLRSWDPVNQWTLYGPRGQGNMDPWIAALACDSKRRRLVRLTGRQGGAFRHATLDISQPATSQPVPFTLAGPDGEYLTGRMDRYENVQVRYVAALDMLYALDGSEMALYAIHPESWECRRLTLKGAPPPNAASFHGRFQWHNKLGALIYHGMADTSNTRSAVWVVPVA